MESIAFIVDRLSQQPFNIHFSTLAQFDSQNDNDTLRMVLLIITEIDEQQQVPNKETNEMSSQRIVNFLRMMKYDPSEVSWEELQQDIQQCHKNALHHIMHWLLQRFDLLKKRAYLAKYLVPAEVPADFMNDDLIYELSNTLRDLQAEFKEVHKAADKLQGSTERMTTLKSDIIQLEQEKTQLQNKIQRMKKDVQVDESYFQEMLKATSMLRKEQEEEATIYTRIKEHRQHLQEIEHEHTEITRRLNSIRSTGAQNLSAEQLLVKLQQDVKELYERKEGQEQTLADRENLLEKLENWNEGDRVTTQDDVQVKREQVRFVEEQITTLQQKLDAALERNPKLTVFRQASSLAQKKLREREEEAEKLTDEKKKLTRMIQDKETEIEMKANQLSANHVGKNERNKLAVAVKAKNDEYKKKFEDLSLLRSELVVLQRTEQIMRTKYLNSSANGDRQVLEQFAGDVEKKRQSNGPAYRLQDSSAASNNNSNSSNNNVSMQDDAEGNLTLEQLGGIVDRITREFKQRQTQLQPLMTELRAIKQEHTEVESNYNDKQKTFEKLTIGLEMEKIALEKECDECQDECVKEESRYHYLMHIVNINKIKVQRAEQEKKWQQGDGKLMRDFSSFKDLYNNKLQQQEQLIKQLRKSQRDLKETGDSLINQKQEFLNMQKLLQAKAQSVSRPNSHNNTTNSINNNNNQFEADAKEQNSNFYF